MRRDGRRDEVPVESAKWMEALGGGGVGVGSADRLQREADRRRLVDNVAAHLMGQLDHHMVSRGVAVDLGDGSSHFGEAPRNDDDLADLSGWFIPVPPLLRLAGLSADQVAGLGCGSAGSARSPERLTSPATVRASGRWFEDRETCHSIEDRVLAR